MKCSSYYMFIIVIAVFLLSFSSCKKNPLPSSNNNERTVNQKLKDSVYYYYQLYSLWSDTSTLDNNTVFSFTNAYDSPSSVLDALKKRTPFHAGYNDGIDRFSYLRAIDSDLLQSASPSYGIFVTIGSVSEKEAYPVLYFVEGGSSAARAGIIRSDVISSIDGKQDLSVPVSCDAEGCKVLDDKIYQSVVSTLLNAMQQGSMQIKVRHIDHTESTVVIYSNRYVVNPIIKNKVFVYPAKAIGYLALSSFEEAAEGDINRNRLDKVFKEFEQQQIKDLIFDLRYNTGGYVSTVEYIANKVIGSRNDGALMYKYILNAYLAQHPHFKGNFFDNVHFQRQNNLNLSTVYFLVTDATASASELMINVLRPYMNVIIIAEHNGTYGKPVGFFKQEIMGKTALWAASFKLTNARGETDYWDGIAADQKNVVDYIFRDFGDVEESMVSAAINHAIGTTNSSISMAATSRKISLPALRRIGNVNSVIQKGMLKEDSGND